MSSSSDGYHAHSTAVSLAADPRSVLGSGAARSCQQPGLAPALARGDYVEIGERDGERADGAAVLRDRGESACFGHVLCAAADAPGRTPGIAGGGTAISTGTSLPHVLPRAGLIDINGHDSPPSPYPAQHVDTRAHRARWPTGLARHSKPNRRAEVAPDVESGAQM